MNHSLLQEAIVRWNLRGTTAVGPGKAVAAALGHAAAAAGAQGRRWAPRTCFQHHCLLHQAPARGCSDVCQGGKSSTAPLQVEAAQGAKELEMVTDWKRWFCVRAISHPDTEHSLREHI